VANLMWWLLPDSMLSLVIVIAGLGLMTGLLPRAAAFGLVGSVIAYVILTPFVPVLLDALPGWLTALLLLIMALSFLRAVLDALIGRRAAAHTVGILAADVIRFFFRLLFWPFRLLLR
jgi:hypothetical protein